MRAIIEVEFKFETSSDNAVLEGFIEGICSSVYHNGFEESIAEIRSIKGQIVPDIDYEKEF